jgi:hypothetical protein
VGIGLSRHFQHGADDGPRAALHDGRCCAVSASLDGNAASNQDKLAFGAIALVCRSATTHSSLLDCSSAAERGNFVVSRFAKPPYERSAKSLPLLARFFMKSNTRDHERVKMFFLDIFIFLKSIS